MLSACLSLLLATSSLAVQAQKVGQVQWRASVQAGVGRTRADPTALVEPRFAFIGQHNRLVLAVPLWLRLAQLGPRRPTQTPWLNRWDRAATYLGFLERLELHSPHDALRLTGGTLSQESLGVGSLVDAYEGALDPTLRRAGLRVDLCTAPVQASVMVGNLVHPHLIAAHLQAAPLALAGWDADHRLAVFAEGAVDPNAPSSRGRQPFGGGDIGLRFDVWRRQAVALALYATGVALQSGGLGAHAGLLVELRRDPLPLSDALRLRLEAVRGSRGYLPGYFGAAYESERFAVPSRSDRPKQDLRPAASWYARLRADGRLGPARVGVAATTNLRGAVSTDIYVRYEARQLSAQLMWLGQDLRQPADLIHGDHNVAIAEAAYQFYGGLFAFTTLDHTWRHATGSGPQSVSDWLVGVGYSVGAAL